MPIGCLSFKVRWEINSTSVYSFIKPQTEVCSLSLAQKLENRPDGRCPKVTKAARHTCPVHKYARIHQMSVCRKLRGFVYLTNCWVYLEVVCSLTVHGEHMMRWLQITATITHTQPADLQLSKMVFLPNDCFSNLFIPLLVFFIHQACTILVVCGQIFSKSWSYNILFIYQVCSWNQCECQAWY